MDITCAYYSLYDTDHSIKNKITFNVEGMKKVIDSVTILYQYLKVKKYLMNSSNNNLINLTEAIKKIIGENYPIIVGYVRNICNYY